MELSNPQDKSTSKCPYDKCDGSGLVLINGDTAAICQCQKDKMLENKLKFANIPEEFKELTINSFDIELYSKLDSKQKAAAAKKAAINFILNYDTFKREGKGLYFYSETKGSGKTRLAASIGNALVKTKKIGVKYITTLDLLEEIKKTWHKDSEITSSSLLDAIKEIEILILDDVGVEDPTPWVKTVFYNILNGRMISKKVTIFTSNTTVDNLEHDDRIKNRIDKMSIPIRFPEESIRSTIAKSENEELQEILLQ